MCYMSGHSQFFPPLCSGGNLGATPPPLVSHSLSLLLASTTLSLLWSLTRGRVGPLWTCRVIQGMSCGEAATISHLGLLLRCCLCKCQQRQPSPLLLPSHGSPRSCVTTWHGVSRDEAFAQPWLGLVPRQLWEIWQPPELPHSLPCLWGKPMCVCSSQAASRLPTALSLLLVILQAAKGLIFPVGPHDCGAQFVTLIAYSAGKISVHLSSRLVWVPFQGCRSWPSSFSSLPTQSYVDLSYRHGCSLAFLPLSVLLICHLDSHPFASFPPFWYDKNNLHKLLFTTISLEITSLTDVNRILWFSNFVKQCLLILYPRD